MIKLFGAIRLSREYVAGALLGLPFSYPSPPFYWLALLSFAFILRPQKIKIPVNLIYLLGAVLILALTSNIFAPRPELLSLPRILLSVFSLMLFVYGFYVKDFLSWTKGFLLPVNLLAALVPIFFVASGVYSRGAMVFVVPVFRLWGSSYFPDWPNYIALFFCLGFLIQLLFVRNLFWSGANLLAAFLTTSRMVFLAVGILCIIWSLRTYLRAGGLIAATLLGVAVLGVGIYIDPHSVDLAERLTRTADREAIYGVAADLAEAQPLTGFGSVLFDNNLAKIRHESFHSFYLDLLIRFGAPVLMVFVLLLVGFDWRTAWSSQVFLPVVFLILIGSFLQNYLRHPHIFLFYSAWILNLRSIAGREGQRGKPI